MTAFSTLVTADELTRRLDDPAWVIIDCRFDLSHPDAGEQAYRAGHIPGARYAHLDRDLSSPVTEVSGRHPLPDPHVLCRTLGAWGVDRRKQVVAYDHASGPFAARLWWLLRWLGHTRVAVLDGGMTRWQAAGLPVSAATGAPPTARFTAERDDARWVSTPFVQARLAQGDCTLVDARAAPRYAGEAEPLDPVAGHIPGALNRPFTDNIDDRGAFRPAETLHREFRDLLGGRDPRGVVHMCGSGVTACHNLLAMEIAGLTGSRLYAGSWSEWIRDPSRPTATGRSP